jgi:2-polyprenyl-3-methyl-5-hydroxy-6-metoxy-1,4-benzoquinol methylase
MTQVELKARYPELHRILDLVASQNPLQRKRIAAFLATQGDEYFQFAEELSATLNRSLLRDDETRTEAARSYNRMCMDILREQIRFKKTGVYLLANAGEANAAVYSQDHVMRYYIVGLLLSYLFWPNHYRMFQHFRRHVADRPVRRCLEVGVGHGLFTAEVLKRHPDAEMTVLDISETSLAVARETLTTFGVDLDRIRFIHGDYLALDLPPGESDLLIMGEVLEHVDDAPEFLRRARQLIAPDGSVYMTTCANCPAVDHVWHFHNVQEIRDLIANAGLDIRSELALPAEPVPEPLWQRELVTINYSSILGHARSSR